MQNIQMEELSALLALHREGTFHKAGRALARHPTVVSKRVSSLEERLGVRLVERTTRRVQLTDAGILLAESVAQATDILEHAEDAVSSKATRTKGRLRLALPAAMGRKWLAPLLPDFMELYPDIELEVEFSEHFVDLVAQRMDVAVRIGKLADSSLVAKKLADHHRILCASPGYIGKHSPIAHPKDLRVHKSLQFSGFASYPEWHLSDGECKETVVPRGPLTSNDSLLLVEAAKAGQGILGVGEWLVWDEIRNGTLVRVLPAWAFDMDGGVYLVRPSKKHPPAAVTAFYEWMEAQFAQGPPWLRNIKAA